MSKEPFMTPDEPYFTSEQVDEQIEQLLQQHTLHTQTNEAELVEALQRTYRAPLVAEDRSALARARQRVMGELSDAHLREHEILLISGNEPRPPIRPLHPRRARLTRVLSALAAVLVVGALLASLLVLTHVTKTPTVSSAVAQDSLYSVHNGVAYRIDGSTGKVVWQHPVPMKEQTKPKYLLSASLQVVGSVVYVMLVSDIYAFDARNGKQLWHITNQSNTTDYVRFFVDNRRVYLLSSDYAFSVLNSANGAELWHNTTLNFDNFTINNGNLYIEGNCKFYAVDGATGKVRWSYPLSVCIMSGSVLVTNGLVYFSSFNVLYAVKERGGQKVWERNIAEAGYFTNLYVAAGILYANEDLEGWMLPRYNSMSQAYVAKAGKIYAFVAQTGRTLWTSDPGSNMFNLPITNGPLLIWSQDSKTYSIEGLDARTGKAEWQVPLMCKSAGPPGWQQPVCQGVEADVIDGKLYLLESDMQPQGNENGYQKVYAIDGFDSRTGRLLSTHPLDGEPYMPRVIGMSGGLLYVALDVLRETNAHSYFNTVLVSYRLSDGKEVWRHIMPPLPPNVADISSVWLEPSEAAMP